MGVTGKFIAPSNEYDELITDDTILSFAAITLAQTNLSESFIESSPNGLPFGIEIGFTTQDVDKVYDQAIRTGVIAIEKAKTKP